MARYQGWKNRQTWNVALWIGNDEGLYRMAKEYNDYPSFAEALREMGIVETGDGVAYNDSGLSIPELNRMIKEFRSH